MSQSTSEVNSINADTPYWVRRIFQELRGKREIKYRDTLIAMSLYANKRGRCFPSIKTLAADCGIAYAGMQRRLKYLEEKGLIRVIARDEKNGRQTANGYVLLPRANTGGPSPAGEGHTERTKEPAVGQVSENASTASGTTGVPFNQTSRQAAPSHLSQEEEIWHVASTWRWWFPRRMVVPVEGEPRPVGTVVSVVENATDTCGSSFLESLFPSDASDSPEGGR